MDISILSKPGRVPVALHNGYRLGARLSSCGAPLTRTCNGWSADTASGTGQRMLATDSSDYALMDVRLVELDTAEDTGLDAGVSEHG